MTRTKIATAFATALVFAGLAVQPASAVVFWNGR